MNYYLVLFCLGFIFPLDNFSLIILLYRAKLLVISRYNFVITRYSLFIASSVFFFFSRAFSAFVKTKNKKQTNKRPVRQTDNGSVFCKHQWHLLIYTMLKHIQYKWEFCDIWLLLGACREFHSTSLSTIYLPETQLNQSQYSL